ncbi:spore germination protein XC [Bacillus freudenreichii]|nr:spore germination protein XC [Bacillus freudenreichii]
MKQQYKSIITMFIIFSTVLSGCTDSRSPEQVAYTHGLGIDFKDGEYIVYLQLINMGLLAKTEGTGAGEDVEAEVGKASGKSLDDAIFKLYESAQQEIYWGSMSYIILTERLLKETGIMSAIDTWSRYPETRYQTNVYSTPDDLEKILLTDLVFDVSKALSLLADPKNSYRQSSFGTIVDFRKLLIILKEPPRLAVIPSVTVTKKAWETKENERPLVKMSGLTLYDFENKLLGTLSGKKAYGYRWVNKDFYRANVILESDGKRISGC